MATFLTDVFRRNPAEADPFEAMRREMERLMGDRFPALTRAAGGFAPALDMHATETGVEITAELPGVAETDVQIDLDDDILTLKGEKKSEREEKTDKGVIVTERSYGSFFRSIRLPWTPDPDKVTASFKDGVLTISAPKPAQIAARSRRIEIGK